jgi:hypothetical protein
LILDFIDRDGIEIRSRAFGKLDTSNQINYLERVKELKGKVVWLQGRLNRINGRIFLDTIQINQSDIDQPVAKEFFKREIAGRREIAEKVWTRIAYYPLSNAIYGSYENMIKTSAIKDVFEREGGYIYYFNLLLDALENSPIPKGTKDKIISLDLIHQLKKYVNNLELAKCINSLAVSKYSEKISNELLDIGLFQNNSERTVYEEILYNLSKGLITLILLEDWSKWGLETVYSNYHKKILTVSGGK